MRPIPFNQIDFGKSAAENERNENLLISGYYDLNSATDRCLNDAEFLILGHKGSGKSALGRHLHLTSDEENRATRFLTLKQLPYDQFPVEASGLGKWQNSYPLIWSLHLLLQFVDMKRRGELGSGSDDQGLREITDNLVAARLLPTMDISTTLLNSVNRASKLFADPDRPDARSSLLELINLLVHRLRETQCEKSGVVIVDGLDELLDPSRSQIEILGSLVEAAATLNAQLEQGHNTGYKVLVLCRTDIFKRMDGANTNKVNQDVSIKFDWSPDGNPAALLNMINFKARVSHSEIQDVIAEYFPKSMDNNRLITEYLLDHTRHTPRDLVMALKYIQGHCPSENVVVPRKAIDAGLRTYSKDYFVEEIRNEISGYIDKDDFLAFESALTHLGKIEFYRSELVGILKQRKVKIDIDTVTNRLFEASAFGSILRAENGDRYTFQFRNPGAQLNPDELLLVHRGWRKGLNLVSRRQATRRPLRDTSNASGQMPLPGMPSVKPAKPATLAPNPTGVGSRRRRVTRGGVERTRGGCHE